MQGLTWLLLPIAALGGWSAATWVRDRQTVVASAALSQDYLKGLNFLLNEEPDKAIEVFTRLLEQTAVTPDTHRVLADQLLRLGIEFRRRGESDRAIRLHQELVERESVGEEQRTAALLELGQDFQRSGMLDRAEQLFLELARNREYEPRVLPLLLEIYQQEREWDKAVRIAGKTGYAGAVPTTGVIAQYLCEMAETQCADGNLQGARELLQRALVQDRECARASILLGDMERDAGNHAAALVCYRQAADQDIERLPQVLDSIVHCHAVLGSGDRLIGYLQDIIPRYDGISPVLVLADLLAREQGDSEAAVFLREQLGRRTSVRGLARLVETGGFPDTVQDRELVSLVKQLVERLQQDRPAYSCHECGFSGKTLHWQCPACRLWDTVRPVHGIEGD
jgi:lipopolysaccharide biosynthesis regulator YciM